MTQAPLFWLQHIENALQVVKEIPLWGSPPPFPWEQCSEQIATLFELSGFQVEHKKTHFLKPEDLTSGLGANPIKVAVELSPLQGSALWLMPSEDVAKLTQLALAPQNGMKGFASTQFQEGFYRYLLLNVLDQLSQLKAFADLSAKLAAAPSLPQEGALCIDISLSHPKAVLWGRLICPESFHHAFKQHFREQTTPLLESAAAQQTPLSLRVEIGQSFLSYAQWKALQVGDLILLDRCSYDPLSHKGAATITLEQTPLFRARFKDNHLKIVEYAYYCEENTAMENDFPEEQSPEVPHEEKENQEELPLANDLDEEVAEDDDHLWTAGSEEDVEKLIEAQEVPLTLSVEVARLKMNLEKLLQLKPGNVIELPVHPEQGVDVVLHGKTVAKGELIKLGEALGIKILRIGN